MSTISNTEIWSIAAGSDFTISDAVLTNNPGVTFVFAGAGALSGGEDTAGAAMTEAITATGGDYAMKLIGSSGDDVYTFDATGTLTAADTIDGNAGTDTIQLENNTSATDSTGNAVTAVISANAKGLEIVVLDQADADYAGNATLTIDSGYTDTTLTIDASALDTDPTNGAGGEIFTLTNNDDVAVTVTSGDTRDVIAMVLVLLILILVTVMTQLLLVVVMILLKLVQVLIQSILVLVLIISMLVLEMTLSMLLC